MPPVIAPVIASALASTALSSTAVFAVSQIVSYALVAGASLALQMALQPGQQKQKVSSQQYQLKQALPPLIAGYGLDKVGGAKFVFEAPGGWYLDGIVHCCGPIDGIETWLLNDIPTGIPKDRAYNGALGGLNQPAPMMGNAAVETHLGTLPTQTRSQTLATLLGWDETRRLDGLAYTVLTLKPVKETNFSKVYSQGAPQVYVVARLLRTWDPRDPGQTDDPIWHDSWKWHRNPALGILHFLTANRGRDSVSNKLIPYGFGLSLSRINIDSFTAFADLCDQPVTLKNGGTEPRYKVDGTYNMADEERSVILQRLLATCDGELYQDAGGRIAIRGGQWTDPVVTIPPDHILAYEHEDGSDALAAFNRLKITFKSGDNDYQVIDADSLDDLANQALTGKVVTQDFALPMVTSHSQARRLAKIAMHKGNPRHRLTITTDLYGLLALGERIIRIVLPELGIDDTFLVSGHVQAADGATCKITATSLDASAYAWDPAQEEGTPPAVPTGFDQPVVAPDVTGIAVTIIRSTVSGTVTGLAIQATVNAPSNPAFALGGRYRPQGAGDDAWQDMTANGDWSLVSAPVDDATTYEVELRYTGLGIDGPWTAPQIITATADTTPPGPPTGFVMTPRTDAFDYAFTAPNAPNYGSAQLFGAYTDDFATAGPVGDRFYGAAGQSFDRSEVFYHGTYYFWVRAYNRSGYGDASSTAGPILLTVPG